MFLEYIAMKFPYSTKHYSISEWRLTSVTLCPALPPFMTLMGYTYSCSDTALTPVATRHLGRYIIGVLMAIIADFVTPNQPAALAKQAGVMTPSYIFPGGKLTSR